jgi:flavin-dependent thymidylate synthase
MVEIKIVKPRIWNFEVIKGKEAWKEVVYATRMSGVPEKIKDERAFKMMVENDYSSILEHILIKFDLKMTKGCAPEFLEHRIVSHTGYSTRYIKVSEGIGKETPNYEIILPLHLLKDEEIKKIIIKTNEDSIKTYDDLISKGVIKEISRYVLPFSQVVGIYHVTINSRSLLNLLSLRLCVRASPEFRCIASQLYFNLIKQLPIMRGLVGCRGFMRGVCLESGVREKTPCPFKNPNSPIFIPTKEEQRNGIETQKFDLKKAIEVQEKIFKIWAKWE